MDKSSSFPSRAVVFSVVYTYAITNSYNMDIFLICLFIVLAGLLASFARVPI